MKKTLIAGASTGIVAGMILMGTARTTFADTGETPTATHAYSQSQVHRGMHLMHRWNSSTKAKSLAVHLGIDPNTVKEELKSGKTLKQILQEHGIVPDQLHKAFENPRKTRNNVSN